MLIFFPILRMPDTLTPGVDMTGLDVVRAAMRKIGVLNATEVPSGEDADDVLAELNLLLDRWNAKPESAFATGFTPLTLSPGLSPHTIGPSGTFVAISRPIRIDGANLIVGGLRTPITMRDRAWYQRLSDPTRTSARPIECYYEPALPNGKLWFYPVPSSPYAIELWQRGLLSRMTLNDLLSAPDGYRDAIVKTLAEEICTGVFRVPMPPGLPESARDARATIWANNDETPHLCTRDSGMPGGGRGGWFDIQTRINRQ